MQKQVSDLISNDRYVGLEHRAATQLTDCFGRESSQLHCNIIPRNQTSRCLDEIAEKCGLGSTETDAANKGGTGWEIRRMRMQFSGIADKAIRFPTATLRTWTGARHSPSLEPFGRPRFDADFVVSGMLLVALMVYLNYNVLNALLLIQMCRLQRAFS